MVKNPSKTPARSYIVIEFGIPHLADALPEYPRWNRLALLDRTWEQSFAFDGNSQYRLTVPDPPKYGLVARILAHTLYNPFIDVNSEWVRCGDYNKAALINLVHRGLEHDDDIIQQHFGGKDVIKLLSAADSWSDMMLAVKAINGSHEAYPEVRDYVQRVLGDEM